MRRPRFPKKGRNGQTTTQYRDALKRVWKVEGECIKGQTLYCPIQNNPDGEVLEWVKQPWQ